MNPRLRAGEDQVSCPSSYSEAGEQGRPSSFLPLVFRSALLPPWIGGCPTLGRRLLRSLILTPSRHTPTDTPRFRRKVNRPKAHPAWLGGSPPHHWSPAPTLWGEARTQRRERERCLCCLRGLRRPLQLQQPWPMKSLRHTYLRGDWTNVSPVSFSF